ncbi:aromatic-rich family protein [Thecamonas trahens ATCC 50062]|uniref:Aromatic-rich family protein n=1 Tax=Thecamonas trahens ATCC 50062 TaxID=461836 RepID=A0A0L0D421_THETB|nr:aromatic-rich family protein [Thecamonas trahens ATCC 50062]KNC47000.1 aromatic-rich family protein [Thecamonas trahens ATCC 50062]|eukprot:XP_013759783.1 aromatic-rich family protein [Thecamonas trahens ATCC 50062]
MLFSRLAVHRCRVAAVSATLTEATSAGSSRGKNRSRRSAAAVTLAGRRETPACGGAMTSTSLGASIGSVRTFLEYLRGGGSQPQSDGPRGDKHHSETTVVPYSRELVFDVVADVDRYKEFIPWCRSSRTLPSTQARSKETPQGAELVDAELVIGFPGFSESYVSHIVLDRPNAIVVRAQRGLLFNHLVTEWGFADGDAPNTTLVTFSLSFDFQSALHRRAADLFFSQVVETMVSAFASRCADLHGPPTPPRPRAVIKP